MQDDELLLVLRRYGPGLTREQTEMLDEAPYDTPHHYTSRLKKSRARRLVKMGLMEEDPSSNGTFRRTETGDMVVQVYYSKGWLP